MSVIVTAIIISLASLKFLDSSYIWIGLTWFVISGYYAIITCNSRVKAVWVNISIIIITLTLFEIYLWVKDSTNNKIKLRLEGTTNYRNNHHDILGYAPFTDIKVIETEYYKNELIYDVVYTINKNGLRKSNNSQKTNVHTGCVIFFGGSFTFGSGVNDNEAMPYQVGIKSNGNYYIYNFGFNGYGPHQMLSALEHNLVKNIVNCAGRKIAICQYSAYHYSRSSGLSSWDPHGPKYILGKNGDVIFAGNFDDDKIIPEIIMGKIKKSRIYKKIIGQQRALNSADIDLLIGIINKSKKSFESLYPCGKFHLLFWDSQGDKNSEKVISALSKKGINIHLISTILLEYEKNRSQYELSPYDKHPNALAYEIIANYIVENIL